jgi:uncharacterized protein (DUF488 family)
MQPVIYTIGYEASDLKDFILTLKNAGVETLIDVRALPVSRRPGFSKTTIKNALEQAGIEYVHLRGLGNPAKFGETGRFEDHMKSEAAQIDLKKAIEIAQMKPSCLLCYERKPEECHRNIVVKHLIRQTGQKIENLFIEKGGIYQGKFSL